MEKWHALWNQKLGEGMRQTVVEEGKNRMLKRSFEKVEDKRPYEVNKGITELNRRT